MFPLSVLLFQSYKLTDVDEAFWYQLDFPETASKQEEETT